MSPMGVKICLKDWYKGILSKVELLCNSIIMLKFRSILSLILVLVTTLLVSCGSPNTAEIPPTYTPELV